MTSQFAVLGSPIEHSLSPKIHNFVFAETNQDASYDRFELSTDLANFLESKPQYSGFSLTMPLKDLGYQAATSLSATAIKTRSVNTLLRKADGWAGYNTDVFGIKASIGFFPGTVAVLGSGATARSALVAFPEAKRVVAGRNTDAVRQLAQIFDAEVVDISDAIESEVVISTLPQGVLEQSLPKGFSFQTILDAAYTNTEMPAQNYISGLEMLILQAIAQQRIFVGQGEDVPLSNELELLNGLRALLNMAK